MDNDWPAYNVLTLDGSHWIWKFHPDHSNPDLIHMLLESPQPSYHEIVLPVDCVPKLACFDLEYWDTTMINVDPNDPVQALRTRMSQKYFHNVRTRISNTLSKGKHDALLNHSLLVDIAHKWSIRTIKRFTHSPWGCETYEKHCEGEGLVPYQQVLTSKDWKEHILTNATRYNSAENQGNTAYLTPFKNRHWMSAGVLLRRLCLLPTNVPVHPVFTRQPQLSSISKLPIELLDMIMQLVVDADWSCSDVLWLAGVCALWRDTAERCGQLWHKLSISSPGSGNSWGRWASRITSMPLVKRFMRNSRCVPLDITIRVTQSSASFGDDECSEPAVYALIREVIKHAMRWRTLELLIEVDCPLNPDDIHIVGCIHQTYSLLQDTGALNKAQNLVELVIHHLGTPYPRTKHIGYKHQITPLSPGQTFELHHLRFDAFVGGLPTPMLRHVTRLSVGDSSDIVLFQDLLGILDNCPVLEDLTVRYLPCRSPPSSPPQMRNLKALHFIDTPYPDAAFQWFSEPNLETIEVLSEKCGYRSVLRYDCFVSLTGSKDALQRIRHIDIGGATMTNNELQPLIVACSSAVRISFRASSSDEARTGILRNIRTTIPERRRFSNGKPIHLTLMGWIGVGKTNKTALEEWKKLKKLASSSSDERNLWL